MLVERDGNGDPICYKADWARMYTEEVGPELHEVIRLILTLPDLLVDSFLRPGKPSPFSRSPESAKAPEM